MNRNTHRNVRLVATIMAAACIGAFVTGPAAATPASSATTAVAATAAGGATQRIEITGLAPAAVPTQVMLSALGRGASFETPAGDIITLVPRASSVRMSYGERAPVLMRARNGAFVSDDGRLVLSVGLDEWNEASTVRLTMPVNW